MGFDGPAVTSATFLLSNPDNNDDADFEWTIHFVGGGRNGLGSDGQRRRHGDDRRHDGNAGTEIAYIEFGVTAGEGRVELHRWRHKTCRACRSSIRSIPTVMRGNITGELISPTICPRSSLSTRQDGGNGGDSGPQHRQHRAGLVVTGGDGRSHHLQPDGRYGRPAERSPPAASRSFTTVTYGRLRLLTATKAANAIPSSR